MYKGCAYASLTDNCSPLLSALLVLPYYSDNGHVLIAATWHYMA